MTCRGSIGPCLCFALLSATDLARAWAQAAQSPTRDKKASTVNLGGSASLAVGHQLCSIVDGGRVVCDQAWLSGYVQRFVRRRKALLRADTDPSLSPAAPQQGASLGPVWQVIHGLRDVVSLTAGAQFICALTKQGVVRCWGYDFSAERDGKTPSRLFGNGSETHVPQPVPLHGVSKETVSVSAQVNSVYLRFADGSFTHLNDPTLSAEPPLNLAREVRRVSRVSDQFGDVCYLDSRGRVHCQDCRSDSCRGWIQLPGFAGPVTQIALTCGGGECPSRVAGLMTTGQVQICRPSGGQAKCPQVGGIQGPLDELVQNCGRTRVGDLYCWAMHISADETRARRIQLPEPAVELAARGGRVQCARLSSGKIACFIPESLGGQLVYPPETIDLPRVP